MMLIAGFQKTSLIDYPNKISAVIFTCGCNMNCSYCHNRRIIRPENVSGLLNEDEVLNFLVKRRQFLDGVVITGGEPTLQKDLVGFIEKVKQMGYCVKLDTNGTNPDVLDELTEYRLVDYVAMDIKASLENYSRICCSRVDTKKIQRSIGILLKNKIEYEFRTTYVPDLTELDLLDISRCIKGARQYVLQQYIQVNKADGTYTGKVEKRNIISEVISEIREYVSMLKFRGEFGII